ncbi:hypothetical protein WKI68_14770 [Streptomyces sp. MS1.HAVA.3]|uniref:Uncharacterized protein n=1 Tax=Streptomyces caledonius TaxID=3134107 RepID=A0ABU8U384_9ACTN
MGTFAVRIAKAFDAEVTAVCGTRNVDLEDLTGGERRYDVCSTWWATARRPSAGVR